nr:MAG TPA: chromosome segregation ATPase [Caudoviricetes sp.]
MNYTPNYKIPLYEGSDPTSYLTTYNETMELIDTSLHALALKVESGEVNDRQFTAEISAIKGRLDTAESMIETIKNELATTNGTVSENTENISTLQSQLVEQGTSIKSLIARISALESSFETFKTAQEQKNNAYEDSFNGLSAQISNNGKKQELKNAEFTSEIAKNKANIDRVLVGNMINILSKQVSPTKNGNNFSHTFRIVRETPNISEKNWNNAELSAVITVCENTTNDVIGCCNPTFTRSIGTTNSQDWGFIDDNHDVHTLNTTITFDDTSQMVSIKCSIDEESPTITDVTFTIMMILSCAY